MVGWRTAARKSKMAANEVAMKDLHYLRSTVTLMKKIFIELPNTVQLFFRVAKWQ